MTDVFISYAREDRKFVQRLHGALSGDGHQAWVDWEGIPASAKWMAEVRAAIDEADCFCFVVSPDSVESPVCREEAAHAAASNKRILPLLRREVEDGLVPETVAAHNWIVFDDGATFEEAFATLVKALETEPEHLRTHTRLLVRAKEWDGAERSRSSLLRGQDLTGAEAWLGASQGKEPAPTQLHTAYVLASRKAASRRQRTTIGAVAIALVLSLVLSAVAVIQRGEAQDAQARAEEQTALATSRLLAVRARELLGSRLDLAALLSLEAYRLAPTVEARSAALAVMQRTVGIERVLQPEGMGDPSIAFDPAGTKLAVSSLGGVLSLYATSSWAQEWSIDTSAFSDAVAFDPTGTVVATANQDGTVRLWDAGTGAPMGEPIRAGIDLAWDLAFSPNGDLLAVAGGDRAFEAGILSVLDLGDPTSPVWTRDIEGMAFAVTFSPDGGLVATGSLEGNSERGTATVWDLPSGEMVAERDLPGRSNVEDVAFSPDGSLLAVAGGRTVVDRGEGSIMLWRFDAPGGDASLIELPAVSGTDAGIRSVVFAEDGATLVSAGRDGNVGVFDVETAKAIGQPPPVHGTDVVDDVAVAPGGNRFATADTDGTIIVWDLEGLRRTFSLEESQDFGILWDLAFDAEGSLVASANDFGTVQVYDAQERTLVNVVDPAAPSGGHPFVTQGVAFLPDDSLATASLVETPDGELGWALATWDPLSGEPTGDPLPLDVRQVYEMQGHESRPLVALFDEDGSALLIDHDAGEPRRIPAFLAIGLEHIATAEGGLTLLDIDTLEPVVGPVEAGVGQAVFGPGDEVVVTSGDSGAITVWDGLDLRPLVGPAQSGVGSPLGLAVSPDGTTIAAAGGQGTVAMLDVKTGVLLGEPLRAGSNSIDAIAFSSTGVLASGGEPGLLLWDPILWTADAAVMTDSLCSVIDRSLTPAEWEQFLAGYPYHATCG